MRFVPMRFVAMNVVAGAPEDAGGPAARPGIHCRPSGRVNASHQMCHGPERHQDDHRDDARRREEDHRHHHRGASVSGSLTAHPFVRHRRADRDLPVLAPNSEFARRITATDQILHVRGSSSVDDEACVLPRHLVTVAADRVGEVARCRERIGPCSDEECSDHEQERLPGSCPPVDSAMITRHRRSPRVHEDSLGVGARCKP